MPQLKPVRRRLQLKCLTLPPAVIPKYSAAPHRYLAASRRLLELEGATVDAVADARLVARAVVEHVAQVRPALGACDLRADHAVGAVHVLRDGGLVGHVVEGRPAGAAVKLVVRLVQHRAAAVERAWWRRQTVEAVPACCYGNLMVCQRDPPTSTRTPARTLTRSLTSRHT